MSTKKFNTKGLYTIGMLAKALGLSDQGAAVRAKKELEVVEVDPHDLLSTDIPGFNNVAKRAITKGTKVRLFRATKEYIAKGIKPGQRNPSYQPLEEEMILYKELVEPFGCDILKMASRYDLVAPDKTKLASARSMFMFRHLVMERYMEMLAKEKELALEELAGGEAFMHELEHIRQLAGQTFCKQQAENPA